MLTPQLKDPGFNENAVGVPSRFLRHIRSKHGNSTVDGFVLTDLAAGEHNIEIDTAVTVTERTSGRAMATWPASYRIVADVKPPPPGTAERRWRQGMEDLLFPYGKVPGEFDPEDH